MAHSQYWSCTPFADWLRGTPKGGAKTADEWDQWAYDAKYKTTFRYWLAEDGLDAIQDFVTWPIRTLYDIKYYINNRWVTRTHCLSASPIDLPPGRWCDVGNRILPCLFNELVDFVEIETAWSQIAWGNKEDRAKYNPPFWATGWFRWRTWRSAQAGLDHLDWAMCLTNVEWLEEDKKHLAEPTSQAKAAKEIKELYLWWTQTYRNRPDPYEVSGWTAYCERMRTDNPGSFMASINTKKPEDKKESYRAHKLLHKIEAQYEKEDTEMMIRLIKIRQSLWT